jgi:hypothetical protein
MTKVIDICEYTGRSVQKANKTNEVKNTAVHFVIYIHITATACLPSGAA